MTVLTKETFMAMKEEICGVDSEYVELKPGIGVNVVQMTAEGAVTLASMSKGADSSSAIFDWVAACCVDNELNPVFTREDVMKMPNAIVQKLSTAIARLNGLISTEASEEAEKNSEVVES